jgi:hypothetical protein
MAELYLIDDRAPMADAWERFVPRADPSLRILQTDEIDGIAAGALSRLSEPRFAHTRLRGLTIIAHGNAGYMELGTGLTLNNVAALAPLAARMQHGARHRVRLFGCFVASGHWQHGHGAGDFTSGWGVAGSWRDFTSGAGYQLMRRIAQMFHATVVAACDEQFATSTRDQSLVRGVIYEGPVMQVDPFGAFTISDETRVYLDSRFDMY